MSDSICLVGRTNVGKSLLFNKLVQYKNSIVLNKHGVTRDVNEGKILFEDKYLTFLILLVFPHQMNIFQSLLMIKQ